MTVASTTGMNTLAKASVIIAAIGAINWGLVGVFRWNLVDAILGGGAFETTSPASRVIYIVVGLAGIGLLASWASFREGRGQRRPPSSTERPVGT